MSCRHFKTNSFDGCYKQKFPLSSVCYTDASFAGETDEPESSKAYDNPVYGSSSDNAKSVEADNSRKSSMCDPEHQFDNPIYATKDTENVYSMITDASVHDGTTVSQLLQATCRSN